MSLPSSSATLVLPGFEGYINGSISSAFSHLLLASFIFITITFHCINIQAFIYALLLVVPGLVISWIMNSAPWNVYMSLGTKGGHLSVYLHHGATSEAQVMMHIQLS